MAKLLVTQDTTGYQIGSYGHNLFTDTPKFSEGQAVRILQPLKVKLFFKKLKMPKIDQFCAAAKLKSLDTFFLNGCHSQTTDLAQNMKFS